MSQTPTLPTRKAVGVLYDSAGKPLANEGVVIQFAPSSFVTAGLIQPWTLFPKTNSEGYLEATLFVNELGGIPSFYTIFAPDNDRWTFTVPEGDEPITWSELRARGVINQDWSADLVTAFITNHPDLRGADGRSALELYRTLPGNENATLEEMFAALGSGGVAPTLRLSGTVLEVLTAGVWTPLGDLGGPPGTDGRPTRDRRRGWSTWRERPGRGRLDGSGSAR